MSVTLKLADEDAAVVGSILKSFSENVTKLANGELDEPKFARYIRQSSGSRSMQHIMDIAGAFQIAVRANQR